MAGGSRPACQDIPDRHRFLLLFVWLFHLDLLAACAKPHPLDVLLPGEHGREARVIDGDALVLARGYMKDGRMEVTHRLNFQVLPPSPPPSPA